MNTSRRQWMQSLGYGAMAAGSASVGSSPAGSLFGAESSGGPPVPLKITNIKVTPIALPDPPILAASGCHGPYFLRCIIEMETDAGIVGIGETRGGAKRYESIKKAAERVIGQNAFAFREFSGELQKLDGSAYAGIELACLDACGKATGRRACELLGGPVREEVEFAAYLFYRYAADHPNLINDPRIVDGRGRGDKALDQWGDVRSAESMAEMAYQFNQRWGFTVFKLKAGVLPPDEELETMHAMNARFQGKYQLRIDPNGRWTMPTALRIGKELHKVPLEYYEDPVPGQEAMAEVRQKTQLPMSTNSCVTRFSHIPGAVKIEPVDIVLGDHHGWGGIAAFQELGRICETFGWGLSQHSNNHGGITMAAMAHVGAVVPQLNYASDTHYVWLVEGADIIEGPNIPIRNGKIQVPRGPGLGVALDHDKLAKAHEVYTKCGMTERGDASTMQRVVPGWKRTLF